MGQGANVVGLRASVSGRDGQESQCQQDRLMICDPSRKVSVCKIAS